MVSINFLNRIDEYVQTLFNESKERIWTSAKHIAEKFKLQIVETAGTTRVVLKKKGSRTVIKVGYSSHNRGEYAVYKALENSSLGALLTPCVGISDDGHVMEMHYVPKPFPQAKGEYYWFNPEFVKMRDRLESHFSFIKKYNKYAWGADFHEENMRVMRNGDVKIIDYSNLLADFFSRNPRATIQEAIKGILKLEFPRVKVSFLMKNRVISYKDNEVSYEVAVDPQKSKAII